MAKVTLYTTQACSRCGRAKSLLAQRGVEFEEVNLARDPVGRAELVERTGLMTFPQIVVGEQTVGGFDDLVAAAENGRLTQLLAA